jgi:hypothetical protein
VKVCYSFLVSSKNWNQIKKTIGNLFLDLGKLSFGSLILGSIIRGGLDPLQVLIFGITVAVLSFIVGILIIATVKE